MNITFTLDLIRMYCLVKRGKHTRQYKLTLSTISRLFRLHKNQWDSVHIGRWID